MLKGNLFYPLYRLSCSFYCKCNNFNKGYSVGGLKFVVVLAMSLVIAGCISGDVADDALPSVPLNDTGVALCMSAAWEQENCTSTNRPGQDGQYGRDSAVPAMKLGSGSAGFDFIKRDAAGFALNDQLVDWSENTDGMAWDCVEDNVTGLVWEVKSVNANAQRYSNHTYSWYQPNDGLNGGNAGVANGGSCLGSDCDTAAYITQANASARCGRTDWRLPSVSELLSIADQSRANPPLDITVFPNSAYNAHWTSQSVAFNPEFAWYVYFTAAGNGIINKSNTAHVRLVSGGVIP